MAKLCIPGLKVINTQYGEKGLIVTVAITDRWQFARGLWQTLNNQYVIPWRLKPWLFVRVAWSVYRDS